MSNLLPNKEPEPCPAGRLAPPLFETFPPRHESLGELTIRRALPAARRRTVGPWCFFDRYGPLTFSEGKPMDVAPHPHIGLQTVSWLLEGEVLHRDSIGYEQLVRAGGLNLMTSGRGIAHSEETPRDASGRLNGIQLWIALPDSARDETPLFDHYPDLPRFDARGGEVTVIAGSVGSVESPARVFSPIVGAEIRVGRDSRVTLPLRPDYEHALVLLGGDSAVESAELSTDALHYLGCSRDELMFSSRKGARVMLIGGPPLQEPIIMWWNFVARSHEEIAAARDAWERGERFGRVRGYAGPRLEAPPLRGKAKPNPAS